MKKYILLTLLIMLATVIFTACNSEPDNIPDSGNPIHEAENTPPVSDNNTADNSPGDNNGLEAPSDGQTDAGNEDPAGPDVFFLVISGVEINLDENINNIIDQLGEPIVPVFEVQSCAFDGMDRIFRYPGAELYTYPSGDDDFIHTIAFYDDTIRTPEGGVRLGSKVQSVFDTYGEDYELESGMYKFKRSDTLLEFLVEDEMVIGITYRLDIEIQIG
ncbi:MAG: hypothetical protein FWD38_00635 [Oscillospiraceae bacterium]|nr:hypothetical protein [Oscillospiraceae bacterium]